MKDIFQSYFDFFAIVYINNILVYCNLLLKYKKHVKLVLNLIKSTKLQLNIAKNKFYI